MYNVTSVSQFHHQENCTLRFLHELQNALQPNHIFMVTNFPHIRNFTKYSRASSYKINKLGWNRRHGVFLARLGDTNIYTITGTFGIIISAPKLRVCV
jgi:predicted phosphatase